MANKMMVNKITTHRFTTQVIIKIIVWTVFFVFLALSAMPLIARAGIDTISQARISKSISFTHNTGINAATRDTLLQQAKPDIWAALVKQGYRNETKVMAALTVNTDYTTGNEISIYNVSMDLISDLNEDGFYHRFSIAIDADTLYDSIYVYAKVYLSFEGGPWNEYASSDIYQLHRDTSADSFTIETELADGFSPGYYDIRIELYDADTDQWLLTYDANDNPSLSALPLEDSYYDNSELAVVVPAQTDLIVSGQGSVNGGGLLIVAAVLFLLRRMKKQPEINATL